MLVFMEGRYWLIYTLTTIHFTVNSPVFYKALLMMLLSTSLMVTLIYYLFHRKPRKAMLQVRKGGSVLPCWFRGLVPS